MGPLTPPPSRLVMPNGPSACRGTHSVPGSLQHPSILHENGIYVELARGVIPAEWMAEGRQDGGHSEQPYSQPQQELPHVPERGK